MGHKQDRVHCLSNDFVSSPDVLKQLTLVVNGLKCKFYLLHTQNIKAIFDIAHARESETKLFVHVKCAKRIN